MKIFEAKLSPNDARLTCYMQDLSPEMATADVRPPYYLWCCYCSVYKTFF